MAKTTSTRAHGRGRGRGLLSVANEGQAPMHHRPPAGGRGRGRGVAKLQGGAGVGASSSILGSLLGVGHGSHMQQDVPGSISQERTAPAHTLQDLMRGPKTLTVLHEDVEGTANSQASTSHGAMQAAQTVPSPTAASRTKHLTRQNKEGLLSCSVCLDAIAAADEISQCSSCYSQFHLLCIRKWAQSSLSALNRNPVLEEYLPNREKFWHCPQCRNRFRSSEVPERYYCFCGKVQNPKRDQWVDPHTCGEICEKLLTSACGHTCSSLCHPGPCPPCLKTVKSSCFCGRDTRTTRCDQKSRSCGRPCTKVLPCGEHRCTRVCHEGDCPPCSKKSRQTCRCGRTVAMVSCSQGSFQCSEPCGAMLDCGRHACKEVCHSGACPPCPDNVRMRYCPCGKTAHTSIPCDTEVPTCGDTCGRELSCGQHFCERPCHKGACDECLEWSTRICRCGRSRKHVPCQRQYLCDKKCERLKKCGRHRCKKKCCEGECSKCGQMCKRLLACQKHRCETSCHPGECVQCPKKTSLSCACGASVIDNLPCGVELKMDPPECTLPCRVPPKCHHTAAKKHACHHGPCPPCDFACEKSLPECPHLCPETCHSLAAERPKTNLVDGSIWAQRQQKQEHNDEIRWRNCPPCAVVVERACQGFHELFKVKCSSSTTIHCRRKCGQTLACSRHKCTKPCHPVERLEGENAELAKKNRRSIETLQKCQTCKLNCKRDRSDCSHICPEKCHPGDCRPCVEIVSLRCYCGDFRRQLPCHEQRSLTPDNLRAKLMCGQVCRKPLPSCDHECQEVCHSGPCPSSDNCARKVTIRCRCRCQKESWLCSRVQSVQRERKLPFGTKQKRSTELLECDGHCKTLESDPESSLKDSAEEVRGGAESPPPSSQESQLTLRESKKRKRAQKRLERDQAQLERQKREESKRKEPRPSLRERLQRDAIPLTLFFAFFCVALVFALWLVGVI